MRGRERRLKRGVRTMRRGNKGRRTEVDEEEVRCRASCVVSLEGVVCNLNISVIVIEERSRREPTDCRNTREDEESKDERDNVVSADLPSHHNISSHS